MSGSALLLDNCSVYGAISGRDSKDHSRNVFHGQRVAAIEDEFETPHSGKSFNILSLLSLLPRTSLLPSPTVLPAHKFPLSRITIFPLSFSIPSSSVRFSSEIFCYCVFFANSLLLCVPIQTLDIFLAPISSRFWNTSPQPQDPSLTLLCTIPRKRL